MPVFCTLLAIYIKLFPVKSYANFCPCSRIPTESWRKTRYLTHCELTQTWEIRQSTGCGLIVDTSLGFLPGQKKSGCLWPEERLLGPKGNNKLLWLLSHVTTKIPNLQWSLCSLPKPLRIVCSSSFYFTMAFLPGTKKSPNRTKSKAPTH